MRLSDREIGALVLSLTLSGLLASLLVGTPVRADAETARPLSPEASAPSDESGTALEPSDSLSPSSLGLEEEGEPEPDLSFDREGAYVGLGGTYALENFDIPGNQDDAATVMFRAGYRGYSWLAVELLGELVTTFNGTGSRDNDVKGYAVTVNAKFLAPLGRVEPWAMVGLGFLNIDEDRERHRQDDFVFRPAVGLDLYLTPRWALYGEAAYMLPTGEVKRYDYATFGGGILFRF